MKWSHNYLAWMVFSLVILNGCGSLKDFGKPLPFEWEFWTKPGYAKDDVRKFMFQQCGLAYGRTREEIKKTDECMLGNGFVFHDIKYGSVYICDHKINQELPSCQSLRKQ